MSVMTSGSNRRIKLLCSRDEVGQAHMTRRRLLNVSTPQMPFPDRLKSKAMQLNCVFQRAWIDEKSPRLEMNLGLKFN